MNFDESLPSSSSFYGSSNYNTMGYNNQKALATRNTITQSDPRTVTLQQGMNGRNSTPPRMYHDNHSSSPPPPPPPDEDTKGQNSYPREYKRQLRFPVDDINDDTFLNSDHEMSNSDILLNGSDYWGLDESLRKSMENDKIKSRALTLVSEKPIGKRDTVLGERTLDDSSTLASTDWQSKTLSKQKELDEFELLEQQAEALLNDDSLSMGQKTASALSKTQTLSAKKTDFKNSRVISHFDTKDSPSSSIDPLNHEYQSDRKEYPTLKPNLDNVYATVTSFIGNIDDIYEDDFDDMNLDQRMNRPINSMIDKNENTLNNAFNSSKEYSTTGRSDSIQSSRWGAVTRPSEANENDSVLSDIPFEEKPIGSQTRSIRPSISYSHKEELSQTTRTPNSRGSDSISKPSSFSATTGRAIRPSLSSRQVLRPNSASRPVIKQPPESQRKQDTKKRESNPSLSPSREPSKSHDSDLTSSSLAAKAKELEDELETYRRENEQLKQLREKHELMLKEIAHQKNESMQILAEEKIRFEQSCEEIKQSILKDKRQSAKLLRDAKAKIASVSSQGYGTLMPLSVRTAKQEIDGLTATIEKMKSDHENALKKHKLNEKRSQGLLKEKQSLINSLQSTIHNLEIDKLNLWQFLEQIQSEVKIPMVLRKNRFENIQKTTIEEYTNNNKKHPNGKFKTIGHSNSTQDSSSINNSNMKSWSQTSRGFRRDGESYAEEVYDVDNLVSNHVNASYYDEMDKIRDDDHESDFSPPENEDDLIDQQDDKESDEDNDEGNLIKTVKSITQVSTGIEPDSGDLRVSDELRRSWNQFSKSSNRYGDDMDASTSMNLTNKSMALKPPIQTMASDESSGKEVETQSWEKTVNRTMMNASTVRDLMSPPMTQKVNVPSINQNAEQRSDQISTMNPKSSVSRNSSLATTMRPYESPNHGNETNKTRTVDLSAKDLANHNPSASPNKDSSGRTEQIMADGSTMIVYRNGTTKHVFPDGRSIVNFVNGDTKSSDTSTGLVVYYYAQANTTHTTYPDGLQVYEFPNGQVEKHFSSGRKEIMFPDKTKKIIYSDGIQESYFPDGVAVREYPDARKEIISEDYIRRRGIP